jgi:integrase
MASIHRNPRSPKGVWYCAYTLADGRRAYRSTGRKNKTEAKIICDALAQSENEAAGGELTKDRLKELFDETLKRLGQSPIERISIKDWLESWLVSKENSAPATKSAYQQAVREFLAHLGPLGVNRRIESINERDIEGFIRLLRKDGRGPATINKLRNFLSQPFEKARRLGKIRYNPVTGTSLEKSDPMLKETFTGDQVSTLVRAAEDTDWAGVILFAYGTGARLGDCVNLKWSNLDVAAGIVVFREQKTKARAVLGLHPDFSDWLATRSVSEDGDAPVFPTLAGKPLAGENGLSNTFIKLLDKAGIERRFLQAGNEGKGRSVRALTFHSFRHTAASTVFNQASLKEVTRRVTNHAAGGSLDRYIHSDLEAIRAAVGLIPRLPKAE